MCIQARNVCVFFIVCETRPLPVYPIVFLHPGLPVGGKHSVFHFIHRHVRSFLLVSYCASISEEEGPGEKNLLQYFEFGLQYLVNPTYSTFKENAIETSYM